MNAKVQILVIICVLLASSVCAQEKSKKQIKEEQKLEKQKQVEEMMANKFVFIARTALPQGYKTVNLSTSEYTVMFQPELIISYLPFYGKAYSGIGYGGDNGLKFEGKPDEYTVTKSKKNYQVKAVVKGENDTFSLSLSVSFGGSASLTVNSNNRSTISFNGDISAPVNADEKK
jgi:hypothetical protein